jgi:hypothetical protein
MGLSDDDQSEMNDRFQPDVVEHALSGRPVTDPLAGEVAAVLAELHRLREPVAPDVASRHLAAMQAAFAEVGPQPAPANRRSRRLHRVSRRWALSSAVASMLAVTGGLAAAGALPGPLQQVVHDVVPAVPQSHDSSPPDSAPPETIPSANPEANSVGEENRSTSHGPGTGDENRSDSGSEHHNTTHDSIRHTDTTEGESPEVENDVTVTSEDVSHKPVAPKGGSSSTTSTTAGSQTASSTSTAGTGKGGGKP